MSNGSRKMYKTLQDFVGNTPLVRLVRIPQLLVAATVLSSLGFMLTLR